MSAPAFFKEHLAHPSLLVGAAVALTAGLSVGSYLRAGEMFPERPAPQVVVALAADSGEPIRYMTGADGRVPDYVLGTDHTYRPPEMPTVRTAWEAPAASENSPEPTPSEAPVQPAQPLVYAAPPSLGGDILAVSAVEQATPIG